jgi:two-component system response regulator NreC
MTEHGEAAEGERARKVRVFVVGDHGILRGALRAVLDGEDDMRVVGDAEAGAVGMKALQSEGPDVAIVDTGLDEGGAMAAVGAVSRTFPLARVIAISAREDPGHVQAVLAGGAAGYLVRSAAVGELLAAIRAVAMGRNFIDASFEATFKGDARTPFSRQRRDDGSAGLTPREREVMIRVAEGYTNNQIAQELNLGVKSIETYRARLMEKMGFTSRAELVRFALRSGALTASKPFS